MKLVMAEFTNADLEEACKQWCNSIYEMPERKNGKGFYEFALEIKRNRLNKKFSCEFQ